MYTIGLKSQSWHYLENHWIRWIGTATRYGCNNNIDGVSIISNLICSSVNLMNRFNYGPWRRWSHEHRHCASPILDDVSLNDLAAVVIVHMQSVPITTNIVSSNPAHAEVHSIKHYVIKLVSDLRKVDGFLLVLLFLLPIKLTATI